MAEPNKPSPANAAARTAVAGIIALLILTTVAAYWGVWRHDFINYDDVTYVTDNEHVKHGLDWGTVVWAFTQSHAFNYHPLTWISHALDCELYGLKAGGHHVTNLILHTANSILLFLALRRLTGATWRSGMVAALFALHPLHVESVAWVAERKDVLCAFFGLLALLAYAKYAQYAGPRTTDHGPQNQSGKEKAEARPRTTDHGPRQGWHWYALALLCFALGLLSKPMLVTWPFVLLLLDFWPLGRVTGAGAKSNFDTSPCPLPDPGAEGKSSCGSQVPSSAFRVQSWKPLVIEKLPFFAITGLFCGLTMLTQSEGMMNPHFLPWYHRIGNALVAYTLYLKQLVWPTHMAIFYPHPMQRNLSEVLTAAGLLILVSILVARAYRRGPYGITGWGWYLGMLVPVIGFVQVGLQSRADRYTYLPAVGVFLLVCWAATAWLGRTRGGRILLGLAGALVLAGLTGTTRAQMKHWRNSETLFTHAIAVTENNFVGYGGLAIVQIGRGQIREAVTNLQSALAAAKVYDVESTVNYYMGVALQLQGRGLEALPYLEGADMVADHVPDRNYRLGLSYIEAGRLVEAEAVLAHALEVRPANPDYRLGLAALRYQQGRAAEAEEIYRRVLADNPEHAQAHRSYADFLLLQNRVREAEGQYATAAGLQPPDVLLRRNHATALLRLGRIPEAAQELEAALEREPANAALIFDYAELLAQMGETRSAVEYYGRALQSDPKLLSALNNLAWLLATSPEADIRNGARAVELARRACELTEWQSAFLMGTLAAAHAEAGQFREAEAMAARARDRARADKLEVVAQRNEELRQLYASGKPYREGK